MKFHTAPMLLGLLLGLAASLMWAFFLAYSREGALDGLFAQDLVFIRFAVAGLVLLPVVARAGLRDLGGIGWGRGLALALAAGPLFAALNAGGFTFSPLAHGAVLQPGTAAIASVAAAILLLGERLRQLQLVGIALVLSGIVVIGSAADTTAGPRAWIGDAMFVVAGLSWAAFTIMLRAWALDGLRATAAISFIALLFVLPVAAIPGVMDGFSRIAALSAADLLTQIVVQGALAGAAAVVLFGMAVTRLGAARAALFPALVPPLALVVGMPVTGEVPSATEWTGAAIAAIGLLLAVAAGLQRPHMRPEPIGSDAARP